MHIFSCLNISKRFQSSILLDLYFETKMKLILSLFALMAAVMLPQLTVTAHPVTLHKRKSAGKGLGIAQGVLGAVGKGLGGK